jgi:hypothetical protein
MFRRIVTVASLVVLCLSGASRADTPSSPLQPKGALQPPSSLQNVADPKARSAAFFTEASKVLQHPRCLNCHPVTREPTQGDDLHPHVPKLQIGLQIHDNHGTKALPCTSCHGPKNSETMGGRVKSIPGTTGWALAPASMAWQTLTTGQICVQIKDPARNGNRSLEQIHEHLATDSLVGWAWHPGDGRTPAPGTQKVFGELIRAWIDTGAHCPAP